MMDKARMEQGDNDSISTISVKDFTPLTRAPSYLSEAPPAYKKNKSSAVQIAKIISWTVVAVTFILGGSIIFAAWLQASASCTLKQSTNEKVDIANLQPAQSLVGKSVPDDLADASKEAVVETVIVDEDDPLDILRQMPLENVRVNRMPLEFLFDDLFGDEMSEKNHHANMNCFVEKKKTDEMEEQSPKNIPLPFGLNLTTDPKFVRTTGEKMMVVCESGSEQMNARGSPMPFGPFPGPLPGPFAGPLPGPIPVGPMMPIHPALGPVPHPFNGPIPIEAMHAFGPMGRPTGPIPIEVVRESVPVGPVRLPGGLSHVPLLGHPIPAMGQKPVPLPIRPEPNPVPTRADRRGNARAMVFDDLAVELTPPMEEQRRFPLPMPRALGDTLALHLTPPKPVAAESRLKPEARKMAMEDTPHLPPPLPQPIQLLEPGFLPPLHPQPLRSSRANPIDRTPNESHFIQPRSTDSKKRQKRCTCDCAC